MTTCSGQLPSQICKKRGDFSFVLRAYFCCFELIEYVITNLDSRESLNRGSEVYTVADIGLTCHSLVSGLVAGCSRLVLSKSQS